MSSSSGSEGGGLQDTEFVEEVVVVVSVIRPFSSLQWFWVISGELVVSSSFLALSGSSAEVLSVEYATESRSTSDSVEEQELDDEVSEFAGELASGI